MKRKKQKLKRPLDRNFGNHMYEVTLADALTSDINTPFVTWCNDVHALVDCIITEVSKELVEVQHTDGIKDYLHVWEDGVIDRLYQLKIKEQYKTFGK